MTMNQRWRSSTEEAVESKQRNGTDAETTCSGR
jgi:hypothetical protein